MLWWNIYLASTWQIPVLCSEPCVSSKLSNYLHTLIISSLSPARGKALAQPLFLVTSNINLGLVPRIKWYFDYLLYIACSSKLISNLIMNSLSILNIYLYSLGFKSLSLFICKMNTSWPFSFFSGKPNEWTESLLLMGPDREEEDLLSRRRWIRVKKLRQSLAVSCDQVNINTSHYRFQLLRARLPWPWPQFIHQNAGGMTAH